jgi:hypothetical protein
MDQNSASVECGKITFSVKVLLRKFSILGWTENKLENSKEIDQRRPKIFQIFFQ